MVAVPPSPLMFLHAPACVPLPEMFCMPRMSSSPPTPDDLHTTIMTKNFEQIIRTIGFKKESSSIAFSQPRSPLQTIHDISLHCNPSMIYQAYILPGAALRESRKGAKGAVPGASADFATRLLKKKNISYNFCFKQHMKTKCTESFKKKCPSRCGTVAKGNLEPQRCNFVSSEQSAAFFTTAERLPGQVCPQPVNKGDCWTSFRKY